MREEKLVKNLIEKERYDFEDLVQIMQILRSEEGCPWDREQSHGSIRSCMIEEAYEVVEAIDTENSELLCEELGDLLFQVIFHAQIEAERGSFTVDDVVHGISQKMIHRHPHVFGDLSLSGAEDVIDSWEKIKIEEKQRKTLSSRLRAVPPMLPALMRAQKIAKKADLHREKTAEALRAELLQSAERLALDTSAETLGDLLLSAVTLAASQGIDSEKSLSDATDAVILLVEESETE